MSGEETRIQAALGQLDPLLFLDKRWSHFGGIYYCVCRQMEDGSEPLVVVDWRVGVYPKELSLDIVDQVRAQEGSITEAVSQATANNAARKELARQKRLTIQDEIVEEWQKSGRSTGIAAPSSIIVSKDLKS